MLTVMRQAEHSIGVGRFRILGGGGANSNKAV